MAQFGGLCNNLMNSTTTTQILAFIQKEAGHLPFQRIQQFIRNLSPSLVNANLDLFESFYRAIVAQYQIRLTLSKDIKMQDVTSHIISIGSKVNEQLSMVLKNILHNRLFVESIKKSIEKNKAIQNIIMNNTPQRQRTITVQSETVGTAHNIVQNKTRQAFNFEVIRGPKNQQSNKLILNKQTELCYSLQHKPQCVCLNQKQIVNRDEFSFKCAHCYRLFHTVCFKRKPNAEYCSYCFIEKMVPVKKIIKTVYIGLLRRNVKKHCANFPMPALENSNQKLQVRCLRLKEGAQTSCIFPDIAEFLINNHKVRDFEPINKQSCLKYRKDQPFIVNKGEYYSGQENSLIVNESLGNHKEKQIRYESQNHILGIFLIEDLKIDVLIKEMQIQNTMGFSQSKTVLLQSFKLGKGDEQLSCQLVKIPLSCPLSTNRIQIPARGIFCTHFQCFDLKNYLTFISQSQNPRWKCPLCPNLAYELQIDSITQQILKENKDNQKIQQILFFKNGDYTPIIDDSPAMQRKNIKNLKIPEKKRKHEPPILEEPPVKKQFLVPVNAQVIELDD